MRILWHLLIFAVISVSCCNSILIVFLYQIQNIFTFINVPNVYRFSNTLCIIQVKIFAINYIIIYQINIWLSHCWAATGSAGIILKCETLCVCIFVRFISQTTQPSDEARTQGLLLLSGRTSYRQISWSLEATRDRVLWWWHDSEIWQATLQGLCRGACQSSERLEKSKPESGAFETLRGLAVRRSSA